ncbi:MAG TPA: isoprenylcysteine carboxylmethyltransferase family protein [Geminicoccus sp.]|uniref:methyltransferase family protein n=1 Tax=Geminicoccus sp. TaxID=2024832 RepID=UPI002E31EB42|nr:isoprenylcysteine carboxylmethyltransferase family protein [Geminicoccus sp.]HEX2526972.1 isoprenylcysteine carboxylmethyltransferase family protein [Geminicoccus sp.]
MNLVRMGALSFKHRGLLLPIAVVILLIPGPHLVDDPAAIGLLGLVVALIGQAIRNGTIGLAYIIRGGKDHKVYAEDLVTSGIYAHVRNPMYLGNAFLLAGLGLATNSWVFMLVGVPIGVATHATIMAAEEDFLRRKFGPAYEAYCARVPRLLPKLSGLTATIRSMTFNGWRVLRQEYAKPFDWIVAIALVTMLNLWRGSLLAEHRGLVLFLLMLIVARLVIWLVVQRHGQPPAGITHPQGPA